MIGSSPRLGFYPFLFSLVVPYCTAENKVDTVGNGSLTANQGTVLQSPASANPGLTV